MAVEFMDKQLDIDAAIKQFVDVVRRYCAWVEGSPEESHQELVTVRQLL
jgi:hypothetical protein